MTTLVRPDPSGDHDIDGLRARASEIASELDERRAEFDRARSDIHAFEIAYRQQVGTLHEQLDELEAAIAEAELGELAKDENVGDTRRPPAGADLRTSAPRYASDAVRTLFRDVAKLIHPDLARDEQSRDRRHTLMIEANRAYVLGDEELLRSILQAWEQSPEAVPGSDPAATRLRLVRRIAQGEEELEAIAAGFAALKASPLWQLKVMVDEASVKGKDLVGDMVARLRRDIMVARNRLDAMRPPA